jgi:CubicO group peptidase (beta-lactamase class C family)
MHTSALVLVALAVLATSPAIAPAQSAATPALDAPTRARIDSIFAAFDKPTAPGCALLARRDGATVYARGYGMASLELGVPNSPRTVMDIGSASKQFTAAAVLLLAQDGKLSLDDEVQRWVPELPRMKERVTLRHLLHHTSGWRDYTDLLGLDGMQEEAVTTASDALASLARQRALNFAPGTFFTYSNTGYFLLGQVVERASGRSMREFLRERIFTPLGMTHTDLFDDHTRVFPGRAPSYNPGREGEGEWRVASANWEQTGDGAIQTSVEDLARWDDNFDRPVVGGPALVDALQQSGRFADGSPFTYAGGLFIERVRGVRRVQHGGAWAAYRAATLRYPDLRTSVYLTCNAGNAPASMFAERVAAVLLGSAFGTADSVRLRDSVRVATLAAAPELRGLVGAWWNPTVGGVMVIELRGDTLVTGSPLAQARRALARFSDGTLVSHPVVDDAARWRPDASGNRIVVSLPVGSRFAYERITPAPRPDSRSASAYAGRYDSPEATKSIVISSRGDTLFASLGGRAPEALRQVAADLFVGGPLPWTRFARDARGRVVALELTSRGMRGLRFERRSVAAR